MGHRSRLAFVSAVTAGILLALLFVSFIAVFRQMEIRSSMEALKPALLEATAEVTLNPKTPDLEEIATSNPEVSLAVFDSEGKETQGIGSLLLSPDIHDGKQVSEDAELVALRIDRPNLTIVGALPWAPREKIINRFAESLAILWLPLVLCISLVTWFAARATFVPLTNLAREAEALSVTDLSHRLSVQGDDEYAEFAARLNGFLDLLQESVQRQERFVADAAHELRTPLTVIRGRIETTLLQPRGEGEYRAALQTALGESERLSTLVETLLQSATPGEQGACQSDLEAAMEKCHARWVDHFAEKRVELSIQTRPATVSLSPAEIDVVLDNLLFNAMHVSAEGDTVQMESHVNGQSVVVSILDQGGGVPANLQDRIFDRFVRGEPSRNRALGGFGIGLAVCKRIVEAHRGKIGFVNELGGARFLVELPLVSPSQSSLGIS